MKIVLLLIALLLLPGRLFAGEPEQGIGLGSPEPNTIGLLGAFFLFGIPTWLYRRRRAADAQRVREAEEEEPYAVVRKAA